MGDWPRATPWRQGSVLSNEDLLTLIPLASDPNNAHIGVVISHSCDVANNPATEPHVEIIVAQIIQAPGGNFLNTKNSRLLHLPFNSNDNKEVFVELSAINKVTLNKCRLAGLTPAAFTLTPSNALILQRWLSARYYRSAFPDTFNNRLKTPQNTEAAFEKLMKRQGYYIKAIFFLLDNGQHIDRETDDDPYELSIELLYDTQHDPAEAERIAKKTANDVTSLFTKHYLHNDEWRLIELVSCEAIAETAMTIIQSQKLQQYRFGHLSLREDPAAPMLDER